MIKFRWGISFLFLPCLLLFQSCSSEFESAKTQLDSVEGVQGEIAGEKVYEQNCAKCHNPLTNTTIPKRSPSQISVALQTITDMAYLSKLSAAEIQAVSKALGYVPESGDKVAVCDAAADLPAGQLFRLTKTQYALMLESLFGVTKGIDYLQSWPNEYVAGAFDNNGLALDVNEILLGELMAVNEKLIDDVWANTTLRNKALTCNLTTAGCVDGEISRFLEMAFRRIPETSEFNRYKSLFDKLVTAGENRTEAYKTVLQTMLVSPSFMFNAFVRGKVLGNQRKQLTDIEIANRISFMIWGAGPDQQLITAANSGSLKSKSGIQTQINRLLKDARANYFAKSFLVTWLIPNSNSVQVSAYAKLTDQALKDALAKETELFLGDLVSRDAPLSELVSGKSTFLNDKLASHYGISGSFTSAFQKIDLPAASGVLSQGRILAMTGRQEVAAVNVILRGKWFMDRMLCQGPPPPANQEQIDKILEDQIKDGLTTRQMSQYRTSNAICASCHSSMDNYGFTFEGFDSFGRSISGSVDNVGVMPDKVSVTGVGNLSLWLDTKNQPRACFGRQMGAFAYGRPLATPDECVTNKIGIDSWDMPLSHWLTQMVLSDGFQQVK